MVLNRIEDNEWALCQGLKEIDSIWVILKESISWGEKKEERKLDTSWKRYTRHYHKHANNAFRIL